MTTHPVFDPNEEIPDGRFVIEASAGTGKTFTIAALVARLVAVDAIPLDEILVVTFTKAATAELRARVRARFVEAAAALSGKGVDLDEPMAALVAADADARAVRRERLLTALRTYDRAQIFTIHGFASRLLLQLGFRSRLAADLEPTEVDKLLMTETASDLVVGRFVDDPLRVLSPKVVAAIGDAVISTPDAVIVPRSGDVADEAALRVGMANRMAAELERRLLAAGVTTFDGSLVEARDALSDPGVGAAARELLAARYRVALVDESQDTDPIQWQVIHAVFDDRRLVVIGDPKQSIYAFRGADVESYLAAVEGADARRTLETNWRSDGPLLAALDQLFAGATFGDHRIAYHRVLPASDHMAPRITGAGPPLVLRRIGAMKQFRRKRNNDFRVGDARAIVAADVAAEVVRLLTSGAEITDGNETRSVGPKDIAVLCRTRAQVDIVRTELSARGVPSVAARTGSVFTSPAADAWRRLLLAVERPERNDFVRLAATSDLVGFSATDMADLDDERMLALQQSIRHWRGLLLDHGVPALLAEIDRKTNVATRVLSQPDGERILTDLIHIAEEMHEAFRHGRLGSLLLWLETAMEDAKANADSGVEEPESRQRRLETDAAAVQVQTIHGAKGLEYPIVLVPFAWDPPSAPPGAAQIPIFHEEAPVASGVPRHRLVDVGGSTGPDFTAHRELAAAEGRAEEGRLLYVALTRARHLLRVWWVEAHSRVQETKLNELLIGRGPNLEELISGSGGTIDQIVIEEMPPLQRYAPDHPEAIELERATLERPLDHLWRRVSFSSLSPEHPVGGAVDAAEGNLRTDDETGVDESEAMGGAGLPMAELPRGASFGSLVHHVLEVVPLDTPDLREVFISAIAAEQVRRGLEFDPAVLADGLILTCETPLGVAGNAPTLHDLDPGRALKEMTFELPVRTEAGSVTLEHVGRTMLDYLDDDDPYRPYAEQLTRLPVNRFRGYMTGAIDFTTVLPDAAGHDRFVVMDYKSNALASVGDMASPADYGGNRLVAAMSDGNYVLQALFYQVALHRYLQWRLPDYHASRHLGGAMYLFVRGMVGPDTPVIDGSRCGVAQWQPATDMIVAMSHLFSGSAP